MPRYAYQARDQRGELVAGHIDAADQHEAVRNLRNDGRFVVEIASANDDSDHEMELFTIEQRARRVRREDVIYFAHQMAMMLQTGVPISEALDSVTQQTTNDNFRSVLDDVTHAVHSGASLSAALSKHPRVFPSMMISLIQASEVSGTMGDMLERISIYLAKERQTITKVRGALIYPAFMAVIAVAVTAFLLMFVLPRFARIYEGRGAALPLPTQLLIGISQVLTTYWYAWAGTLATVIGAALHARRMPMGRRLLDHLKLRLPVLGPMFNQLYITRAMQTMGTMISAGVPMLEMIAITRNVTRNVYYQELWDAVDEQLRQGSQLSMPLSESPLIPRSISRMINSGERAGRLGLVMQRIAEFTENDFDESVRRTTQFIEPAMVTVMGIVIGGVAISLLLPIFSIGKVMAGG